MKVFAADRIRVPAPYLKRDPLVTTLAKFTVESTKIRREPPRLTPPVKVSTPLSVGLPRRR